MRRPSWRLAISLTLAALISCADPRGSTLNELGSPPLASLGPRSRQQYRNLQEEISRADSEGDPLERARAWGALAQWHDVHRFFDSARLAYENAGTLAPEDPRWPHHMGRFAYREGAYRQAEALWRRVLDLAPNRLATTVMLAEALLAQAQDEAAETLFRQAVAQRPSCARARAGLADIALRHGDLAAAATELQRALVDQPDATSLRYQLGIVYRQQGLREKAAAQFALVPQSAVEHSSVVLDDPWMRELDGLNESVTSRQEKGMRAYRRGRWAEAEREFRLGLEQDPENLKARENLAHTLLKQGHLEEAIAEMDTALEVAPGSSSAHNLLATLLAASGRASEAEANLRAALKTDPDHKRALHNLGQILLRSGRLEEALVNFNRAVELDPQLSPARHGRAVVLWLLDRHREAIEQLAIDLSAQPRSQELAGLMARFLTTAVEDDLREGARALELVTQASLAGENVSLAETRAMVLAELGRHGEAETWQRAAMASLEPTRRRRALARAQRRLRLYVAGKPCRRGWEVDEVLMAIPVDVPGRRDRAGK